jgi:hypothetical protein
VFAGQLMAVPLAFGHKSGPAALGASERLDLVVDPHVDPQVA